MVRSPFQNQLWGEFRLRSMPLLGHHVRTAWEAILIMQQHGFPTRFLHWSISLAVAARCAGRDIDSDEDGAVWVMAARRLFEPYALETLAPNDRKHHRAGCFLHTVRIPKSVKPGIRTQSTPHAGVLRVE